MTQNRGKHSRPFRPVILVYCEGETEKEYLTCLKKDRYKNLGIRIEPKLSNNNFKEIFQQIEQQLSKRKEPNYLYIFYVLDLDVIYNNYQTTEYNERKKKVESMAKAKERLTIIESKPCIEFWFLLHFKNTDKCFTSFDEVKNELCKAYPDYCKSQKYIAGLYIKLQGGLETAIQNSQRICSKPRINNEDYSYTEMHNLILFLDDLQKGIS
ncbi:MAG TPA: RloB family protein [Candidatus Cloacimonas sp.]|mgnify:CR=1 FL=1|nr:RloB family protein [Candidatus Cloacimonas sp.]HPS60663.1 RloB family protein [Candidatus Cloacimonas sp.]